MEIKIFGKTFYLFDPAMKEAIALREKHKDLHDVYYSLEKCVLESEDVPNSMSCPNCGEILRIHIGLTAEKKLDSILISCSKDNCSLNIQSCYKGMGRPPVWLKGVNVESFISTCPPNVKVKVSSKND